MIVNGSAGTFHEYYCASCHTVPGYQIWLEANETAGLHVIHTSKRKGPWEPFYISTNLVPYFDERIDWEGRCNKMVQVMTIIRHLRRFYLYTSICTILSLFRSFKVYNLVNI